MNKTDEDREAEAYYELLHTCTDLDHLEEQDQINEAISLGQQEPTNKS